MQTFMTTTELLTRFCHAVETGDGPGLAALFTDDGVYHDVFYGRFAGRVRIAAMLTDFFYRDARAFRWDMHDPVSDGQTLYARYVFSFTSKLPGAMGKRAMFEGVSIMTLRDGFIVTYREVANPMPGLADLGFAPERMAKIAEREGRELKGRVEAARHLAG